MRHPRALLAAPAVILAAGLAAPPAHAEGTALRADLVEGKSIKLDGVPKEWGSLVALTYTLRGKNGKPDLEARAGLAYDAQNLYVAADVTDDVLRGGGGDRVEVVIGFPGGAAHSVFLYPGDPGKSPGVAKTSDGSTISGAKVVEAPRSGGWSLEAAVPWSAFPPARTIRVGLRGAIFVHDADSGTTVKNVVGTAPSPAYASLPSLNTEAEQSLHDGLLKDKGLRGAPRFNLIADVAGDGMKERVLVYDRWLVVLGSNFRKGSEYYFSDQGGDIVGCEVRDLTGDGQSEIILRKRYGSASKYREMMAVLQFGNGEVPVSIFQHEVAVVTPDGAVQNDVSFVSDGARTALKITPASARGFTAGTYREPTESGYDSVVLPWGTVASQTYKLSGTAFAKASEERQAAAATPAPAAVDPGLPKAPPPPSASELMDKVYDLYKHDRGQSGRPRFDLAADVSGDGQNERVLLHDRDIVIFGKSYKGGTGYSFLTMSQFAAGSDITDLTARDVNGDGKAEVIVKGVLHASGPGGDRVDREILLVFQVVNDGIRRVFAAELGRSMGRKRIYGAVRFPGGAIELAPGGATEWTAATYPFTQDSGPVGGLEPLLLPWGGAQPVRYRWSNGAFSR
jgi:Carbohydrate family 9 binding domain-like